MRIILGSFKERMANLGRLSAFNGGGGNNDEADDDYALDNARRFGGTFKFNNRMSLNQVYNLPWDLIRLSDAQFLYLRAKLFKLVCFILLNLLFYILLIIKFNCCGLRAR